MCANRENSGAELRRRITAVSNDDEFCIKNEELCIKNEEFCINNKELCSSLVKLFTRGKRLRRIAFNSAINSCSNGMVTYQLQNIHQMQVTGWDIAQVRVLIVILYLK